MLETETGQVLQTNLIISSRLIDNHKHTVKMSGAFFFEHVVEAILNLEDQAKAKNAETKSSKSESVKNPKKK